MGRYNSTDDALVLKLGFHFTIMLYNQYMLPIVIRMHPLLHLKKKQEKEMKMHAIRL